MSLNSNWDVNKYREEHECDNQWELRRAFLLKWKDQYPEERLVCLARVFTNIEFMGCRYPSEVMHEVARLSADVAKQYRTSRKTKLQRTFVSASDAAEDRAKGVKRHGGVLINTPQKKRTKVEFIPQGQIDLTEDDLRIEEKDEIGANRLLQRLHSSNLQININSKLKDSSWEQSSNLPQNNGISSHLEENSNIYNENDKPASINVDVYRTYSHGINYLQDMMDSDCLDPRDFEESMFTTEYGKFVLVIRPWADMISNLISTCATCKSEVRQDYKNGYYTITLNKQILASAIGDKVTARTQVCRMAWDKLRRIAVILMFKEQWVSQGDDPISVSDIANRKDEFGEPIEQSVALKMMKLMGWKGGGLGADNQGISEPIKPKLRMVRRAGLGHESSTCLDQLKRAGFALMRRRGVALDADLVFASDFSSEERAVLHQCARGCGLQSKSYGKGDDRFLVVTNKLRPFTLAPQVLERGGETAKYRVFLPATPRA